MRRVFAFLLITPLLASCSDSVAPVAPAGPLFTEGAVPTETDGAVPTEEEWPAEENWFSGDVLTLEDEQVSALRAESLLQAQQPTPAVMVFGNPDAGTPYPPGTHDQSLHGRDRIIPGSVVIDAGETVTFKVNPGHRVAIYADGMRAEDVLNSNPGPFVLYPVNRLFLQGPPVPQFTLKFTQPGKYLVICAIKTHFFNANMWGWVHVR